LGAARYILKLAKAKRLPPALGCLRDFRKSVAWGVSGVERRQVDPLAHPNACALEQRGGHGEGGHPPGSAIDGRGPAFQRPVVAMPGQVHHRAERLDRVVIAGPPTPLAGSVWIPGGGALPPGPCHRKMAPMPAPIRAVKAIKPRLIRLGRRSHRGHFGPERRQLIARERSGEYMGDVDRSLS
jgi:hypothetical protein